MAIDPRIAMGGVSPTYDAFGAMRQGQEIRQNQMAMQAAQTAADRNVLARQRLAALQPDDDAGFNALVSEFGDNPLVAAVGTNRNRMRDDTRAAETQRLAAEKAERERDEYSIETSLPDWVNASRNPDDATLTAAMARAIARPNVNVDLIRQTFGSAMALPPEARAAYMADIANSYTQSRAARAAQYPDIRTISYGDAIGGLPNADPTALTAPIPERAVALSPAQRRTDARAAETDTREDVRNLQRRWDAYDDAVVAHDRWVASADGPQQQAQRAQAPAPRPPAEPRPGGGGGNAPAAPPADRGSPPPAPPAGTPRGATRSNARGTWTWDGSQWR
jgi:hypothetical protein